MASASPALTVLESMCRHDAGRDPGLLKLKYAKMAVSPFVFLRGACNLFYDALPDDPVFRDAPLAWACGDLHFENMGGYKGGDRKVYFDINDFDESALAPCTWDLVRLATSLLCGADELKVSEAEALSACRSALDGYREAVARAEARSLDDGNADGPIDDLLEGLRKRRRKDFLDDRTTLRDGGRRFDVDGRKALPVSEEARERVLAFMADHAARQDEPGFFRVLDVAQRVAGTGSLGVERYVVLVEGKGSPDGNYLIDLKQALPSSMAPCLQRFGIVPPGFGDEAMRAVAVQRRMQAVSQAFLEPARLAGRPFILRGLQPSDDRLDIKAWTKNGKTFDRVAQTMGRILAWDQLRAADWQGAASVGTLAAFAGGDWDKALLVAARVMHETTLGQWREFKAALAAA